MTKEQLKKFLRFLRVNNIILLNMEEPFYQDGYRIEFNEINKEWLFDEFFEEYNDKYH